MLNQQTTPLYSKLIEHARKEPHSLHVPGHKWGGVFPEFAKRYYQKILKLDATELTNLDDLHDAQTVIREAQRLLANYYGAKTSYFLVGGSTVGNLAMLLSVCKKSDTILVQRDSHKSVMNGIQLAQANAVYLTPDYDVETGLSIGIGLKSVKKALDMYPDAKALFLTSPSYYGVASDLQEIIDAAHDYGVPVLVDEAHGAHFGIGCGFPDSAVTQGADIVVQSAHKTLPAMTMGSYLHYNSTIVSNQNIEYYLQILQSSSPSYPIMASLDLARHYVANLTQEQVLTIIEGSKEFKRRLKEIPQITVIKECEAASYSLDPLKVTLRTNCQLTGIQIQHLLEKNGVFVELANKEYLLLVLPLSPYNDSDQIIAIIKSILNGYKPLGVKKYQNKADFYKTPPLHVALENNYAYNTKFVPIENSRGHIIAEQIIPYPPGVPLLIQGELITEEKVNAILKLIEAGTRIQGRTNVKDTGLKVFIIDERKEDEA